MPKPIIATTLSGLFVKNSPWDKAHVVWFHDASAKLKDDEVLNWIDKPNYFDGVDEVMNKLYPHLTNSDKTIKARETFFDSVCKYILQNPSVKNSDVITYFESIRRKYRIALITTNTKDATDKILKTLNMQRFFDIIECSKPEEKDNKRSVFDRFIEKYGKPEIYIGGGRRDSYDYCKEKGIKRVFANFESGEEIEDVKTIHTLASLREILEGI
ncbi:MAG: HAD hydrolase-like protein [Candidatus Pacearchaeota archaeon]